MSTLIINVNMDKQKCAQCGKTGTGFYEATNSPGKYICNKCVNENIKKLDNKLNKGRKL